MSFEAEFTFDGIHSREYGLVAYSISQNSEDSAPFSSGPEIVDEYLFRRFRSFFYGVKRPSKLSFHLYLSIDICRLEEGKYLTRDEIEQVARWLTSPDTYRWLEISQDDMVPYRFRCLITNLELTKFDGDPVGFDATVTCDCPYAYMYPHEYYCHVSTNGQESVAINNLSTIERGYRPIVKIEYTGNGGGALAIRNLTTGKSLEIEDIPSGEKSILIDNGLMIISCKNGSNLYKSCNFDFISLQRGMNEIQVETDQPADVTFICEYPVDICA